MAGKAVCDHVGTEHRALYIRVQEDGKRRWPRVGYMCLACDALIREE